jgi:hypothetical protein
LQRVAVSRRVEDVNWDQVIAQVEDVTQRKRNAVAANLSLVLEHLVKLRLRPGSMDDQTWRHAAGIHLRHAWTYYQPGLHGRIDLAGAQSGSNRSCPRRLRLRRGQLSLGINKK